jgi:hypothetical protein
MPMLPETKYAQSGELSIAYQVLGHGPLDLLIVPGFVSHLEEAWEEPSYARFLHHWHPSRGSFSLISAVPDCPIG